VEEGSPWKVYLKGGERLEADILCLALPAYQASYLVQPFARQLAHELSGIPYESVATVNMAFRRSSLGNAPEGFGFVVPVVQRKTIAACTFSSIKYPERAPEGSVLLRAFVGGALQREMFGLGDAELEKRVIRELGEILQVSSPPLFVSIHRYPNSMPQYKVGHLARVRVIENHLKNHQGLYLTGNAYGGVGIPDCIHHAENVADQIHSSLRTLVP
jgi:oxygen-dependent protoporphyrinogen oxidase